MQVQSAEFYDCQNPFEVFLRLPHKRNLINWTLNFSKVGGGNNIKCQMYFYNSATKNKTNSKFLPEEGIYVHNSSNSSLDLRLFA